MKQYIIRVDYFVVGKTYWVDSAPHTIDVQFEIRDQNNLYHMADIYWIGCIAAIDQLKEKYPNDQHTIVKIELLRPAIN